MNEYVKIKRIIYVILIICIIFSIGLIVIGTIVEIELFTVLSSIPISITCSLIVSILFTILPNSKNKLINKLNNTLNFLIDMEQSLHYIDIKAIEYVYETSIKNIECLSEIDACVINDLNMEHYIDIAKFILNIPEVASQNMQNELNNDINKFFDTNEFRTKIINDLNVLIQCKQTYDIYYNNCNLKREDFNTENPDVDEDLYNQAIISAKYSYYNKNKEELKKIFDVVDEINVHILDLKSEINILIKAYIDKLNNVNNRLY